MPLLCASSSAKRKLGKELGKWLRLVHKRPEGRGCGSRSPEGRGAPALALKPEQPVCEQAATFTLSGLQELKLLTLFTKHFHVEVAVSFDPIFVDFDC